MLCACLKLILEKKIQLVSLQSMVKVNFQRHKMQLREHYCYTTSTGSRGEFCFPFQLMKISHMPESLEPPFLFFFLVILVLLKGIISLTQGACTQKET